ncbi:hypothetical protein EJP82_25400 [Paenibacillus anaericanus]|uniref:Uncharacterized protein n=1 Tax=Paenibacillus anaericanus TaxID=170367 RepID=A0A3S1E8G6_9BACL|nr:hypothetical protein [Paenibacillus anaericanus]RUT40218.1 hypothetical protein EJP82_25400 [Paenibacillus anaericanus]
MNTKVQMLNEFPIDDNLIRAEVEYKLSRWGHISSFFAIFLFSTIDLNGKIFLYKITSGGML